MKVHSKLSSLAVSVVSAD